MTVAIAADHAGFPLKDQVMATVLDMGLQLIDLGTDSTDAVDYPDFAAAIGDALLEGRAERAILICGSGAGACVAANKIRGVRAAICHDGYSAHQAVEDDGINVLCLGARIVGSALAADLVRIFLNARFSEAERHLRRVSKVEQMEDCFHIPRTTLVES